MPTYYYVYWHQLPDYSKIPAPKLLFVYRIKLLKKLSYLSNYDCRKKRTAFENILSKRDDKRTENYLDQIYSASFFIKIHLDIERWPCRSRQTFVNADKSLYVKVTGKLLILTELLKLCIIWVQLKDFIGLYLFLVL